MSVVQHEDDGVQFEMQLVEVALHMRPLSSFEAEQPNAVVVVAAVDSHLVVTFVVQEFVVYGVAMDLEYLDYVV